MLCGSPQHEIQTAGRSLNNMERIIQIFLLRFLTATFCILSIRVKSVQDSILTSKDEIHPLLVWERCPMPGSYIVALEKWTGIVNKNAK